MSSFQQTLDDLAACPRCGRSAISNDEPCARCQPLEGEHADDRCQYCGSRVTNDFRRVQGDNDNVAHACFGCAAAREIFEGAAAQTGYIPDDVQSGLTDPTEVKQ